MDKFSVIRDIAVILAISIPILYLFKKIRLSPVIGFLVTGIVIGPAGMGLILPNAQIEVMAEIGVILLMFTIGLEFSLDRLLKMRAQFFIYGSLQIFATIASTLGLLYFFNIGLKQGIFFGMLISLSSTAIVLKIYGDHSLMDSPHGRLTTAILLFQDISLIPMLIILPLLRADADISFSVLFSRTVFSLSVVALIIMLARYLVPKVLFQISLLRVREVFTAAMIVILLGAAYLTHSIGISFSIGAFIAGFIIAESEFSHQIIAESMPFKDIFNSLFFVSAGLLLAPDKMMFPLSVILFIAAGVIILKAFIVFVIVRAGGLPQRTALLAGISLAQIGEFSFIAGQAGLNASIITAEMNGLILSVVVITMLAAPALIEIVLRLPVHGRVKPATDEPAVLKQHVIIAGFGLNGRNLARVLRETGIPYCVVDLNSAAVREGVSDGESIIYGDIMKREILMKAGISHAKVIVFAVSDPHSSRLAVPLCKQINPAVHIIVRTRYVSEITGLLKAGADTVIPEEFETSLQIFSKALSQYHVPMNVILQQINLIRQDSYEMLRADDMTISPKHLMDVITKSVTETFFIGQDFYAIGRSLRELDLRAKTNANVLAIVRESAAINTTTGTEIIQYGDIIVLMGTHQAVDAASALLQHGEP